MELTKDQIDRLEVIESAYQKTLAVLNHNIKESNEKTLALEKLEEMQFWAIKSVYGEAK